MRSKIKRVPLKLQKKDRDRKIVRLQINLIKEELSLIRELEINDTEKAELKSFIQEINILIS